MRAHPTPMFPVITVGPFTKWGIDYTTFNPSSTRGHCYIIVVVYYFTKWVEAMPTFKDDGETATLFLFNWIISRFNVPREIVTDHGSHFQNQMMTELTSNLGLQKEHSSPYYPQANGQVEAVNKTLKTILQRMINSAKSNWHLMLYSELWAYRMSIKTTTSFSPFQLIYGLEVVLPIECQIPSLKLAIKLLPDTSPLEERLLYLE
jgi:transposase InsO family protein